MLRWNQHDMRKGGAHPRGGVAAQFIQNVRIHHAGVKPIGQGERGVGKAPGPGPPKQDHEYGPVETPRRYVGAKNLNQLDDPHQLKVRKISGGVNRKLGRKERLGQDSHRSEGTVPGLELARLRHAEPRRQPGEIRPVERLANLDVAELARRLDYRVDRDDALHLRAHGLAGVGGILLVDRDGRRDAVPNFVDPAARGE